MVLKHEIKKDIQSLNSDKISTIKAIS